MSVGAKVAGFHVEFTRGSGESALWTALRPHRPRVLAVMLFLILVAVGSVWAVYTMQYYDTLNATQQQQHEDSRLGSGSSIAAR